MLTILGMKTGTGSGNNRNNPPASRLTGDDRSAWYTFCHAHPTLAESLVNVNNGAWQVIVGTRPPTFVRQLHGETRADLQRRVMSMYPVHVTRMRPQAAKGTER